MKKDVASVREELFRTLVIELSPNEQKWLVRIILNNLNIEASHTSVRFGGDFICSSQHHYVMAILVYTLQVLRWYHPMANQVFAATLNLQDVCEDPALRDPENGGMVHRTISPGVPFVPMRSLRLLLGDTEEDDYSAGAKRPRGGTKDGGVRLFSSGHFDDFYIESKLDGERMQVCYHYDVNRY